jgi:FAD/FMN-containing dehydrogenase
MIKAVFFALSMCMGLLGFQHLSSAEQTTPPPENVQKIAKGPKLTGRIVVSGNPEYEKGRLVSNYYTSKDKFPRVIVYCQNTQDVQNAVVWARSKNVPIRIRSGGHNHEGYSTGNRVIVIDVSEMKEGNVDKVTNIATIQPGLNNQELYTQLFKQGLTHVGGTCSEVGISGLVLSGGIGPLIRRQGLTCDNLISVDMVDAKGRIIHATKDNEHKDLFWATCGGGGGNFGVITSMQIKVYPVTDVTWFNIGWDWDQPIKEVISAWQEFFSKPNKNWFSHLDLWAKPFPTEKVKKQPVKVLGFFWGTPEKAREQLEHILNVGKPNVEIIELVDWGKAIKLLQDSTAVYLTDKPEYKSPGAFVMDNLPFEAIKIIETTLRESTSPLLNVLLFSMGGAAAEVSPTDTAYFYRKAKFFINYSTQWLNKDDDQKQKTEVSKLRQWLLAYSVGDYIGNPEPDLKDYLTTYYGDNVNRLRCVKRKYDPENIFRFEQSIPPAPKDMNCSEK